jgi:hypothetical protein
MRIACILVAVLALAGLATRAPRVAGPATGPTPAAFIDLGAIFGGDENEPDENEVADGDGARRQPAQRGAKSISVVGVLLSAAGGAIAALFVAGRLRRLRGLIRRWGVRAGAMPDRRR